MYFSILGYVTNLVFVLLSFFFGVVGSCQCSLFDSVGVSVSVLSGVSVYLSLVGVVVQSLLQSLFSFLGHVTTFRTKYALGDCWLLTLCSLLLLFLPVRVSDRVNTCQ